MPDALEPLRRIARKVPGGMAAGRWLRRNLSPGLRTVASLRKRHSEVLFQPFPDTWEERYPVLFDALADRLAHLPAPRVLSFGCSSGAELRALRQRMPQARLTGIDLNPRALAKARAADPTSEYREAAAPCPGECFDAVLALAVFRHGDLEAQRPDDCSAVLPFARFAQGIAALDAVLEPGGWLAIWHAQFRFADTPTAADYSADTLRLPSPAQDLLWGPDNLRLEGVSEAKVLFRKT